MLLATGLPQDLSTVRVLNFVFTPIWPCQVKHRGAHLVRSMSVPTGLYNPLDVHEGNPVSESPAPIGIFPSLLLPLSFSLPLPLPLFLTLSLPLPFTLSLPLSASLSFAIPFSPPHSASLTLPPSPTSIDPCHVQPL